MVVAYIGPKLGISCRTSLFNRKSEAEIYCLNCSAERGESCGILQAASSSYITKTIAKSPRKTQ